MRGTPGRHTRPDDRGNPSSPAAPARRHARPGAPAGLDLTALLHSGSRAATPRLGFLAPTVTVVGATLMAALLGILPVGAAPAAPAQAPVAVAAAPTPSAGEPVSTTSAEPVAAAAAAPAVPSDPAQAAALIVALRPRIAAASLAFDRSRVAVSQASAAVADARTHAIVAERRAGEAREAISSWAAYLYRTTGGAGLLTQLLDSANDDPSNFLRANGDAAVLGDGLTYDLQRAQLTLAESREASAATARMQAAAAAEADAAEASRQALLDLLSQAQALVNATQGAAGPQTLITAAGCPTVVPANTLRDGSAGVTAAKLCRDSVAQAATPQAALAIQAAFRMLGAPYACKGVGRQDPFQFDCSSLVSRAYYLGAGLNTAGADWAPSTRDMVPWDGVPLASWASYVAPKFARPGDLVLYDTGGAAYRHVVMLLADGYMLHTNSCGDVAHVSSFTGFGVSPGHAFLVARRVLAPGGIRIPDPVSVPTTRPVPGKPVPGDPGAGDPPVSTPPTAPVPTAPVPTTPAPTTSTPVPSSPTTVATPKPTTPAPTTSTPAPTSPTTTASPGPTSPTPSGTTSPPPGGATTSAATPDLTTAAP